MRSGDFSLRALYEALDAERRRRGLSWSKVAREINGPSGRSSGHQLSPSTVTGTRTRTVAEGDGILQMLRWLNRTPESFVSGHPEADERGRLPEVPSHHTLRFDTKKLHAALDAQRVERGLTWAQVAQEVGIGVSSLTHLSHGGRTAFPPVMRIVRWLAQPAAEFTRTSNW
jgi:hypothetical protein